MKTTIKPTQSKQRKPSGKQTKKTTEVNGPQEVIQKAMSEEQTAEVAALNRLHEEIFHTTRMTTEKAIDLGGRLDKLRRWLGHGKWLPFVKAHLSFSSKTAERYMNVFKNRKALVAKFDNMSNFALTDAYGFLAETKKSNSGRKQAPAQAEVQPEADKNAVMKELSRSVREQIKPLSAERISQFKEALLTFMKRWMEQQVGGSENGMKLIVLPSPVIAGEEREVQGLPPEADPSDFRLEVPAEGVTVAA